jgi:hypothetical protein
MNPFTFAAAYPSLVPHPDKSGIHLIFTRFSGGQVVALDETRVTAVL